MRVINASIVGEKPCSQQADRGERQGRVERWRGGPGGLRFHLPLIEPDGRISRIRLSDKDF
jgi:hypothetical protein